MQKTKTQQNAIKTAIYKLKMTLDGSDCNRNGNMSVCQ